MARKFCVESDKASETCPLERAHRRQVHFPVALSEIKGSIKKVSKSFEIFLDKMLTSLVASISIRQLVHTDVIEKNTTFSRRITSRVPFVK